MSTPSSIVLDGRRLNASVFGRDYRGTIAGFLVFWLQIAIEPFALLHYSDFNYIILTVMFHRWDRGLLTKAVPLLQFMFVRLWFHMWRLSLVVPHLSLFWWFRRTVLRNNGISWLSSPIFPVSILYKSITGRYRPVRVADGPIKARYRFIKNASCFFCSA